MAKQRRYALTANDEINHMFPIYDDYENKFFKNNNLIDLDYFLYSQYNVKNAKELRLFLIEYYKNLLILINSQLKNSNQMRLTKTIVQELKYLNEHEKIIFKISYKNSGKTKYLDVHYNLNSTQTYFLEVYNFCNQSFNYDTQKIKEEIISDENFNIFLKIIINQYSNQQFKTFINNSSNINSYVKNYLNNTSEYFIRNVNDDYIRTDERDFYEQSKVNFINKLVSYKTLRTFLEQINIYDRIYKENTFSYLNKKIELEKQRNIEMDSSIFEKMEEYYDKGYDLKDFYKEDLEAYPDGVGPRKK